MAGRCTGPSAPRTAARRTHRLRGHSTATSGLPFPHSCPHPGSPEPGWVPTTTALAPEASGSLCQKSPRAEQGRSAGSGVPLGYPCWGVLTPAMGEAPVAGGTAGAVPADDVGAAGALAPERLARGARGSRLVAAAGQSPVVVEERQRDGGRTAEWGRAAGAGDERCEAGSWPEPRRPPGLPPGPAHLMW